MPLAFAGLLAFHGLNNWRIMARDTGLILNDPTSYFSFVVKLLSAAREGAWHTLFFDLIPGFWKPPLYLLVSAPLLLVQRSINMAAMSNLFFLGVTMLCLYGAGRKLYNRTVGALAAFIFCMTPAVFAVSRLFFIETALAAMVTLTFYLLVSGGFRSLPAAALTGAVMGLGLLTKQTYPLYALPLALYFVLPQGASRPAVPLRNVLLAAGIAVLIASFWYVRDNRLAPGYYHHYWWLCPTPGDHLFYARSLFGRQLFPVFFAFFIFSSAYALIKRQYFLPAYIAVIIAGMTLSNCRLDRHIHPVFPFIALLSAHAVVSLSRGRAVLAGAPVLLFSFLQYGLISYRPQEVFRVFPSLERDFTYNIEQDFGMYAISPKQYDWKTPTGTLLAALELHVAGSPRPLSLTDLSVLGCGLEYRIAEQGSRFRLEYPCLGQTHVLKPRTDAERRQESEAVMARTDLVLRSVPAQKFMYIWDMLPFLEEAFEKSSGEFRLIAQVPCPRGNTVLAYARKEGPADRRPGTKP